MPSGEAVEAFTLSRGGFAVRILTFGATIERIELPDAAGVRANVVLGYQNLDGYVRSKSYFGATIGRYANRIADGRFTLGRRPYVLPINDPPNSLHGGAPGFDKAVWRVRSASATAVELAHTSPDGDQGYPGRLEAQIAYRLDGDDGLQLDFSATTDAPTIVNLTNHSYFNLAGESAGDVLDHELQINAARYTPVDARLIPTGERAPVDGTPFDFRQPRAIGERIREPVEQLVRARGYDHNYVLDAAPNAGLAHAARVVEPHGGRSLDIFTTEPGLQFYSGNFLDASEIGSGGTVYRQSAGFALETQHFPNTPNVASFPSVELGPSQVYSSQTVFRFGHVPGRNHR